MKKGDVNNVCYFDTDKMDILIHIVKISRCIYFFEEVQSKFIIAN